MSLVVITPGDDRSVGPQSVTGVAPPRDGSEPSAGGSVRHLAVVIVAPCGDRSVGTQSISGTIPIGDSYEPSASWSVGHLAITVIAPCRDRPVRPQCKAVGPPATRYCREPSAGGSVGHLTIAIIAPRHDRPVGPQCKASSCPTGDGRESRAGRRVRHKVQFITALGHKMACLGNLAIATQHDQKGHANNPNHATNHCKSLS